MKLDFLGISYPTAHRKAKPKAQSVDLNEIKTADSQTQNLMHQDQNWEEQ